MGTQLMIRFTVGVTNFNYQVISYSLRSIYKIMGRESMQFLLISLQVALRAHRVNA